MDPLENKEASGCGKKLGKWMGIPIGLVAGGIAGDASGNFVLWLPIGLALGLLWSVGLPGGG